MKTNKRRFLAALTASALALTPCFAAGTMTAFAAESITIKNAESDPDNAHSYKAYCIIKGTDIDSNGLLKGIDKGDNIESVAALATALKGTGISALSSLSSSSTLQEIVEALENVNSDTDKQKIAKALSAIVTGTATPLTQDETSKKYSATVSDKGWYLITDTKNSNTKVISANLLQVLGEEEVDPKFSLPTIEKNIVEGSERVKQNEASIGDTIEYELKSKVPKMDGYDKYFFVINDIIDDGLTFDPSSVKVYIDGAELENSASQNYFRVDTGNAAKVGDAEYSFQIVMLDFIQHAAKSGKDIVVTYSAVLNENADITNVGNPNEVLLTYSNNPNVAANGESTENPDEPKQPDTPPGTPDNPGDDYDAPVGVTPKDKVNTFTTAVKIKKVDNKNAVLHGAEFTLTGNGTNIVLVSEDKFEAVSAGETGEYWKLLDGTYTKTDPATEGIDSSTYADTTTKYKRSTIFTQKGNTSPTAVDIKGYVDDDGYIIFKGLGAGKYKLKETVVPDGYNKADDVEFEIGNGSSMSITNPDWTNDNTDFTWDGTNYMYNITIKNVKGSTLPETGGMGTKLFYVFGSLFVIGGATFMVTKKRVGNSK